MNNNIEIGLANVEVEEVITEDLNPTWPDDNNMDQYLSLEAATEIMFPF
jgi:hypothetical protein